MRDLTMLKIYIRKVERASRGITLVRAFYAMTLVELILIGYVASKIISM